MRKTSLEVETITPMFMYGAGGEPELRASEFKGMMRFWWRAAYGGKDLERMRRDEGEIFGSTEKKSRVRVEVIPLNSEISPIEEIIGRDYSLRYIYFSPILQRRRRAFKPGVKFKIQISAAERKAEEEALKALWLAVNLGGFGARARRCGGNLKVHRAASPLNSLSFEAEDLEDFFGKNLAFIKPSTFEGEYSKFPRRIFYKEISAAGWKEAVREASELLKTLRMENRGSREFFGLPFKKNKKRRSSPLVLKISEINGKYFLLVYFLSGTFMGREDRDFIEIKNRVEDFLLENGFNKLWGSK